MKRTTYKSCIQAVVKGGLQSMSEVATVDIEDVVESPMSRQNTEWITPRVPLQKQLSKT